MKHLVSHSLSIDVAKRVTERAFSSYRQRYEKHELRLRWLNETQARVSFSAKGIKLSGTFEITPAGFAFDLKVPLLLRLFQRRAVAAIEREVRFWTQRAQAGEL